MRATICFALVALLVSPAAARPDIEVCSWSRIPMDMRQAPDPSRYEVQYLPNEGVQLACRGYTGGPALWGCARKQDETFIFSEELNAYVEIGLYWHIFIDEDLPPSTKHCVLFHEYAHLPPNNWCGTHEGRCPP
jgi:hypothetical protein